MSCLPKVLYPVYSQSFSLQIFLHVMMPGYSSSSLVLRFLWLTGCCPESSMSCDMFTVTCYIRHIKLQQARTPIHIKLFSISSLGLALALFPYKPHHCHTYSSCLLLMTCPKNKDCLFLKLWKLSNVNLVIGIAILVYVQVQLDC